MRPFATNLLHLAPKLLVALVVDEVLHLLRQIGGHKDAEEVSVGVEGGIVEDVAVDLCVVLDKAELGA